MGASFRAWGVRAVGGVSSSLDAPAGRARCLSLAVSGPWIAAGCGGVARRDDAPPPPAQLSRGQSPWPLILLARAHAPRSVGGHARPPRRCCCDVSHHCRARAPLQSAHWALCSAPLPPFPLHPAYATTGGTARLEEGGGRGRSRAILPANGSQQPLVPSQHSTSGCVFALPHLLKPRGWEGGGGVCPPPLSRVCTTDDRRGRLSCSDLGRHASAGRAYLSARGGSSQWGDAVNQLTHRRRTTPCDPPSNVSRETRLMVSRAPLRDPQQADPSPIAGITSR